MSHQAGTRVTENVTLVRPLTGGAMGAVWVAEHETLETEVAVKFISPELLKGRTDAISRFRLEATAAAKLKSPHVVQMLDHGVMEDDTPYIVMELLEGRSLHERIIQGGQLSLEDTATIVSHVTRALAVAHSRGIIHRDIKPHNIFLVDMPDGLFAKVLDFGIAKRSDVSEDITEPGTIVGTPHYVCRDLILGGLNREVDRYVDMWALAVVAYKCLTAKLPFDGDTLQRIVASLSAGTFTPPSELHQFALDPALDAWFARALHPERGERFADVERMSAALQQLAFPRTNSTAPPPLSAPVEGESSTRLAASLSDDPPPPRDAEASADDLLESLAPARHSELEASIPVSSPRWPVVGLTVLGIAVGIGATMSLIPAPAEPPDATPSAKTAAPGSARPSSRPPVAPPSATTPAKSAAAPTTASAPSATPPPSATASAVVPDELPREAGKSPGKPLPHQVAIPSGTVAMGCAASASAQCRPDELPLRPVWVSPFFLDRFEVRVIDYAKCVLDGRCDDRAVNRTFVDGKQAITTKCNWHQPGRGRFPMNCVNHTQAEAYCEYRNGRLPREAEWERAARGDDRRMFPWGDKPANCVLAVMGEEGDEGCGHEVAWRVGSKAGDRGPFGALDMAGNVREWVADWYAVDTYRTGTTVDPKGPESGEQRVLRGGSWRVRSPDRLRVSLRWALPPRQRSIDIGFRCAYDPK